jgi:hypothetical protein
MPPCWRSGGRLTRGGEAGSGGARPGQNSSKISLPERFGQPRQFRCDALHLGKAGDDHHRDLRTVPARLPRQFNTGHARHQVVGDDQIDWRAGLDDPRATSADGTSDTSNPRSAGMSAVLMRTSSSSSTSRTVPRLLGPGSLTDGARAAGAASSLAPSHSSMVVPWPTPRREERLDGALRCRPVHPDAGVGHGQADIGAGRQAGATLAPPDVHRMAGVEDEAHGGAQRLRPGSGRTKR